MTRRTWFAGKTATGGGNLIFQFLLRLAGPARAATPGPKPGGRRAVNSGAEPCWTAAVNRGGDLPPFRLSILNADDFCSPMRLETYGRDPGPSGPSGPAGM